jgi:ribosome-associated translation inhibitor RaiA
MKTSLRLIFLSIITLVSASFTFKWGFFAHQKINRLAVFTLPVEMIGFYKDHLEFIEKNAVNPDKRRYTNDKEASYHYIDLDEYGDSALICLPKNWNKAKEKYTEDTLMSYGIVPWHIYTMKVRLTDAFRERNKSKILRLSADLGHYIADANVPLHTTKNYNGQLTNQHGIHSFWEGRLPELFSNDYDFFIGPATYLNNPQLEAWKAVENAHLALDSVFIFEKQLTKSFGEDRKYVFDNRNNVTVKTYSKSFSKAYHQKLSGQVEKRMKASIKMVGDFWYTCWVDAGQPNLDKLILKEDEEAEEKVVKTPKQVMDHDF